jgi:cupin 2 domain-containing protein
MNIFRISEAIGGGERSDLLIPDQGVRIERIVSAGHSSPPGFWYDQERDEWVCLVQGNATIAWHDGRSRDLSPGDCLLIPAHEKHRVEWTSQNPPCIWLAVHGKLA